MKKIALITGASSGIGSEFARIFAAYGNSLVLVARNSEKLANLKDEIEKKFNVEVYIIVKDLSIENASEELYFEVQKLQLKIEFLINNAGFGNFGYFQETNWKKEKEMLNLNIIALTHLTKLFLRDMLKFKSGKILNVASTAAFQPGPLMSVYFASKAYVLHFSEAIHNEVKKSGISVTALCPGPTKTGFKTAALLDGSALFESKNISSAYDVALFGYKAMMKNKPVAVHGFLNKILVFSSKCIPRKFLISVTRKLLKKGK